jgi:hypothetical protein
MATLIERITDRCGFRNVVPVPELLDYAAECDKYSSLDITSDEMQDALCRYLDASSIRGRSLSEALGRVKEPPLSEVVTEATNMLVDSIIRTPELRSMNLQIHSEKNVKLPAGGYRKPDVGIWKDDQLLVVVECKTSLGHRRNDWLDDYNKRVFEFEGVNVPSDSMLLFVGSEHTWKGFPRHDSRFLSTWFPLAPTGAWHGGGKTGELPLSKKNNKGVIEIFASTIKKIVLAKA